jgi:hypothetical protein
MLPFGDPAVDLAKIIVPGHHIQKGAPASPGILIAYSCILRLSDQLQQSNNFIKPS